jgi:high-affinity K+ transport system ATPase subunit B
MTRDGILKLARECGIPEFENNESQAHNILTFFARIQQQMLFDGIHTCNDQCQRPACVAIRRAVKREREACAKVADLVAREVDDTNGTATYIAAAIRVRGER